MHYNDVIMSAMASQITSLKIAYSTVCSGADQRKHQSSPSLASVRGIHRSPVNFPHKRPVTRRMFPFDDVIMWTRHVAHGVTINESQWMPRRSCNPLIAALARTISNVLSPIRQSDNGSYRVNHSDNPHIPLSYLRYSIHISLVLEAP